MEKKQRPVLLIVAFILIILTAISFSLVVATYSRYITTKINSSENDGNNPEVAKFDVSEYLDGVGEFDTLSITLKPGEEKVQNIIVSNSSEVAISYTISLENVTNNLPLEFTNYSGTINANETNVACSVTISWDKLKNSPEFAGKTDVIRIIITAEQIVSE